MSKLNEKKKMGLREIIFGVLSLTAFVLILYRSDIAIEYMKKGLRLCTVTVIPSLFPFMIISELIIKNPAAYKVGRVLRRPMSFLFGTSEVGGCAFIFGALCGFPIGARTAALAYDCGHISKEEFSRLLCFCNNPGSAFVISAVGVSLLGSKKLGILLYACVILSSIIVGIFLNIFFGGRSIEENSSRSLHLYNNDVITTFTSAVGSSAITMLTVCAYVVFFGALMGCIEDVLISISAPKILSTLIFGLFEMTGGVSAAANINDINMALILCAAFLAWSGISVHCQIIAICSGRGLSYKKYFISKAVQGILCSFMMGVAIKFLFPDIALESKDVFMTESNNLGNINSILPCVSFFLASVLSGIFCYKKRI